MDRTSVSSSNVDSIGYDSDNQTLEVEFNSGTTYQYYDVPEHVYDDLLSSSSVGSYLNQHVKNSYSYDQV
ncbi:MAG: KTSC domain-containing protein [Colwellia sp.]|jgi:hypothetical protein